MAAVKDAPKSKAAKVSVVEKIKMIRRRTADNFKNHAGDIERNAPVRAFAGLFAEQKFLLDVIDALADENKLKAIRLPEEDDTDEFDASSVSE